MRFNVALSVAVLHTYFGEVVAIIEVPNAAGTIPMTGEQIASNNLSKIFSPQK
jgi:hypothetical protein